MFLPNKLKPTPSILEQERVASEEREAQKRVEIESGDFKMPFGKYKTWSIKELPGDYLQWIIDNFEDPSRDVYIAAEHELTKRGGLNIRHR